MASISTMVAIAADRYRVMVRRQALARYETLIIICVTWLVAFCISAPQLYEYNIYHIHNNETNLTQMTCGSEGIVEHFETVYAATVFILAYCVPFLVLVICYVKVLALIQRHTNRFRLSRNSSNITTTKNSVPIDSVLSARKVRVLKMLVAITVAFGALWTPYFILFAIQVIPSAGNQIHYGFILTFWKWGQIALFI